MCHRPMCLRTITTATTLALIAVMALWQGCADVLPGPLTAEAGPDLSVGIGQTVVLGGGADGGSGGTTFSWSPATGLSNPNVAQPTFTATTIGVTVFTLTVKDSAGNTATDSMRVETAQLPLLAEAGPDLSTGVGVPLFLLGAATGGTGTYVFQWSTIPVVSPAELIDSTTATPQFTPSAAGVYTFTLTVTDSQGFVDTDFTTITVEGSQPAETPAGGP